VIGRSITHFKVIEKIGAGGMGVVYRAEDLKLGRPVALKFLPAELVSDPVRRKRFLREARTEAALAHPGIAAVFEVDEADGHVFIAMELVEGRTLRSIIDGRAMPVAGALKIASELAEALAFAHAKHVIHRDLKPENVMVRDDGHVKVLDFGLAKLLIDRVDLRSTQLSAASTLSQELTREGRVVGTAAYMAPEQARGETPDARADVFALGVILYEMLTGESPFRRGEFHDTLNAVIHADPQPPGELNPEIPQPLRELVMCCLEKDRERRCASTADLWERLEKIRDELTALSASASQYRNPGPSRRVFVATALAAVAVAALAGTLALPPIRSLLFGAGGSGRIESVAVLPFENTSDSSDQEYLVDGIADTLIADLSKIRALTVISWAATRDLKPPRSKTVPTIARELGVQALLDGRVTWRGDRIQVTAQLVEGTSNKVIWADSYVREIGNMLDLQTEISKAVAREIRISITPQEEERISRRHKMNPAAYEAYLRGRLALSEWNPAAFRRATEHMTRAVQLDPTSAVAYAGLAQAYITSSDMNALPAEAMSRARAAALEALKLDDSLAEAYVPLAMVRLKAEWDWAGAERDLRQAISLEPSSADGHMWYGYLLVFMGRFEEAQKHLNRARELNPLSRDVALQATWPSLFGRRYERAFTEIRRLLDMEPSFNSAHVALGWVYQQMGDPESGLSEIMKAAENDDHQDYKAYLAQALALAGRTKDAEEVLDGLLDLSRSTYVESTLFVPIYAALGRTEEALDWLEKAADDHTVELLWLKVDPRFDSLRNEPRFQEVCRRIGFTKPA